MLFNNDNNNALTTFCFVFWRIKIKIIVSNYPLIVSHIDACLIY